MAEIDKEMERFGTRYDFGGSEAAARPGDLKLAHGTIDSGGAGAGTGADGAEARADKGRILTDAGDGGPDNPGSAAEVIARGGVRVAAGGARPRSKDLAQDQSGSGGAATGATGAGEKGTGGAAGGGAEETEDERERREAVEGTDRQIRTIRDWMDAEENRPETAQERLRRERKEKSRRIVSAVTDGLAALSNLYFTSQYAPNMYSHERSSQLRPLDERLERAKAERERKKEAHLNFALKLGDLENGRARTLRDLKAAQEERRRKAELHPLEVAMKREQGRKEGNLADKADADKTIAQLKAGNTPTELADKNAKAKKEIELAGARIQTEGTKQRANLAAANKHNAEAGLANKRAAKVGKKEGFWVVDGDGKRQWIADDEIDLEFADLDKESRDNAGNNGAHGRQKPTKEQQKQAIAVSKRGFRAEDYKRSGSGSKNNGKKGGSSGSGKGNTGKLPLN